MLTTQISNYELILRAAKAVTKRHKNVCVNLDQCTAHQDADGSGKAIIVLYNSGWPMARYRWNGRRLRQLKLRGNE